MKKNLLYLSYDSLLTPISSSQIIPLILNLNKNYNVSIISFENNKNLKTKNLEIILRKKKIKWIKIFNKKKLFYIKNIFLFLKCIFILTKIKNTTILARSYLPIWLSIISKFLSKNSNKIIADIRGFWLDEKFETSKINLFTFKFLKIFEKLIFTKSDHIITLSEKSKEYLKKKYLIKENKVSCIYTFANKKFKIKKNRNKKIVFGYIGNIDMHYNFKKVIKFLKKFNEKEKEWKLIITNNYNQKINHKLFKGIEKKITLVNTPFCKMHNFYKKIDVGIYFLKQSFSKIASCPTKLPELITSNTMVISNGNIGDINFMSEKFKNLIMIINKINNKNIIAVQKKVFLNKRNNNKKTYNPFIQIFNERIATKKYTSIINNL